MKGPARDDLQIASRSILCYAIEAQVRLGENPPNTTPTKFYRRKKLAATPA